MPARTSKPDALLRLARRGPFRARDLDPARIPRTCLRLLCERGLLERIDRGLYRLAGAEVSQFHSLALVSKRVPRASICLLSALALHGLTTEAPHAVWVLLERGARTPRIKSPRLRIVRASGPAREHGVLRRTIDGIPVRVTSPAKTVADCFRYRSRVGMDVALEALRDYLRRRAGSIDALVAAAKADRVYSVLRPYLEALA